MEPSSRDSQLLGSDGSFLLAPEDVAKAGSDRLVGGGEGVGVDTQGHRRVGVAEAAGDGTHAVALADSDSG